MTMAQIARQTRQDYEGVHAETLKPGPGVSSRSHILVQRAALRGELERNDSGRMVICDDTDIPDLLDLSEWRGR